MLESRDLILYFELHKCAGWKTPNDLLGYLQQAITVGELIPLENQMIRLEDRKSALPVCKDFSAVFTDNYRIKKEWDPREFNKFYAEESLHLTMRTTLEAEWRTPEPYWEAIEVTFEGLRYGEIYNYFAFFCSLAGHSVAFPNRESQLERVDEIGQIVVNIAQQIIPGLAPAYGVITDNRSLSMYGQSILNKELDAIHWCNYLGPEYLEKYGVHEWMGAPGYEQKRLGQGIWYQIAKTFHESRNKEISEKIAAHFHTSGLKKVRNVRYIGGEL